MTGYRWRPMTADDLGAVSAIAMAVHPGFFERDEVLAEKQQLYPEGAWLCEADGTACGYLLSHPWHGADVPALDTLLGAVPVIGAYYLHDLALLPKTRGLGAAGDIVGIALGNATAAGFRIASLVAVNNSQPFWQRRGFDVADDPTLAGKLAAYEAGARYMTRAV